MLRQLLYKWFGLDPVRCETCEVLRTQLDESNRERKELLSRLLDKEKTEPPPTPTEEYKPIQSQFVPWRVRQQMLEAEDARKAALLREKELEMRDSKQKEQIENLEKELDIAGSGVN